MNSNFWMWHASYEGPGGSGSNHSGTGCMIDVVLEKGAEIAFSGTRLLVVFRETEILKELSLQENLNHVGQWYMSTKSSPPPLRDVHSRRRTDVNAGKALLNREDAQLCTLILELVMTTARQHSRLQLVPLPSLPPSESDFRIAYDRIHVFRPFEPHVLTYLTCSHTFFNQTYYPETNDFKVIGSVQGIYAHTLRIIPVHRSRPSFRYLDAEICRNIAWHAVYNKPAHWRRSLLNLALVSRTWAGVVDLFFHGLPNEFNQDRAPVSAVARTVQAYPHKGRLIRQFEPWANWIHHWADMRDEVAFLRFSHAILNILRKAPLTTRLALGELHLHIRETLVEALRGLMEVEEVKIKRYDYSEYPYFERIWKPEIAELQNTFAGWEKLKKVEFAGWGVSLSSGPEPRDATYNLEELSLHRGALPGTILTRFLSSTPALHYLDLDEVTSFTNSTLRRFLATVAPTLVTLHIARCILEPYDSLAEEPALDAVMPKMHLLSEVFITCEYGGEVIATPQSVRAKPMVQGGRATLPGSSFTIHVACEIFDTEELLYALQTSGWEHVTVRWNPPVDGWDRMKLKLDYGKSQYIDIGNDF